MNSKPITQKQADTLIAFVAELIQSNDSNLIVLALGRAMQQIEFNLMEIPEIKRFREDNPSATLDDFIEWKMAEFDRLKRMEEKIFGDLLDD